MLFEPGGVDALVSHGARSLNGPGARPPDPSLDLWTLPASRGVGGHAA